MNQKKEHDGRHLFTNTSFSFIHLYATLVTACECVCYSCTYDVKGKTKVDAHWYYWDLFWILGSFDRILLESPTLFGGKCSILNRLWKFFPYKREFLALLMLLKNMDDDAGKARNDLHRHKKWFFCAQGGLLLIFGGHLALLANFWLRKMHEKTSRRTKIKVHAVCQSPQIDYYYMAMPLFSRYFRISRVIPWKLGPLRPFPAL